MPLIALDADGVLLNYHDAYRGAWARAFGVIPALRNAEAYWPIDRWEVETLSGRELENFRSQFDHEFWSTIPANEGAVDACLQLTAAGFDLVCVTAIEEQFSAARLKNLRDRGFPIDRVFPTTHSTSGASPKAGVLTILEPIVFVDDYLPYFRGLPASIHTALILRESDGSPNVGDDLKTVNSQHHNLAAFASWWLSRAP